MTIAGRLEGKSSLGRLGLLTHSTAGFIDPGFSGHITLELSNVANLPVKLFPGMKSDNFASSDFHLPLNIPTVQLSTVRATKANVGQHQAAPG